MHAAIHRDCNLRTALIVCAVHLLFLGCSKPPAVPNNTVGQSESATERPNAPGTHATPVPGSTSNSLIGEIVTSGEYHAAALNIEQAATKDGPTLNACFDYEAMLSRAIDDIDVSSNYRRQFKLGALKGAAGEAGIGAQVAKTIAAGGSYRLLRVHRKAGVHYALFRIDAAGALNYHNYRLTKQPHGVIRAEDVFVLRSGETLVESMRKLYLPLAANQSRSLLEKLSQSESDYVRNFTKLGEISKAVRNGDHASTLSAIRLLPESMQNLKPMLISWIDAAAGVEQWEEAKSVVATFRKRYPQDLGADLASLSIFVQDRDFRGAYETLDHIDKIVGGDSHLNLMRARIARLEEKPEQAEALLLTAIEDPQAMVDGYYEMIDLSVSQQQFDKTVKYLLAAEERYSLAFGDLKTIPEFAPFVASTEYQNWMKRKRE
jgi:hypothetical protein